MNTKKFLKYLFLTLGVVLVINITYLIGYFRHLVKKQNEMILVLETNREVPPEPEYPGNVVVMQNVHSKKAKAS